MDLGIQFTAGKQLDAFGVFVLWGIREASEKAALLSRQKYKNFSILWQS